MTRLSAEELIAEIHAFLREKYPNRNASLVEGETECTLEEDNGEMLLIAVEEI
jgi:hypothetical protein